jgi:hypothetical protein
VHPVAPHRGQPDQHRERDHGRAGHGHRDRPRLAGVGADADAVDQAEDPRGVRREVQDAPGAVRHPVPQQARQRDGHEEVQRQGSQGEPQRLVRRPAGDDHVLPPDVHVGVGDGCRRVGTEQQEGQQGHVPVQPLGEEPGPPPGARPGRREDPQRHREGEQPDEHHPRATVGEPEERAVHEPTLRTSGSGQPPTRTTRPSRATSRAGLCRDMSHRSARSLHFW